jgi:hypothetical protein
MRICLVALRTLLCCVVSLPVIACNQTKTKSQEQSSTPVFPRIAEKVQPVELSEFIANAVPENGVEKIGWDYLSNSSIVWVSNGYENYGGTETWREGLVRIRVGGVASTVLRQKKEELAWSISLVTDGPPKFGPTFIKIEPGFDVSEQVAKQLGGDLTNGNSGICFGELFTGCDFTAARALASHRIRSTLVCKGEFNVKPDVYEIRVGNKPPALLTYSWGGGSGGSSADIELHPLADKEALCSQHA